MLPSFVVSQRADLGVADLRGDVAVVAVVGLDLFRVFFVLRFLVDAAAGDEREGPQLLRLLHLPLQRAVADRLVADEVDVADLVLRAVDDVERDVHRLGLTGHRLDLVRHLAVEIALFGQHAADDHLGAAQDAVVEERIHADGDVLLAQLLVDLRRLDLLAADVVDDLDPLALLHVVDDDLAERRHWGRCSPSPRWRGRRGSSSPTAAGSRRGWSAPPRRRTAPRHRPTAGWAWSGCNRDRCSPRPPARRPASRSTGRSRRSPDASRPPAAATAAGTADRRRPARCPPAAPAPRLAPGIGDVDAGDSGIGWVWAWSAAAGGAREPALAPAAGAPPPGLARTPAVRNETWTCDQIRRGSHDGVGAARAPWGDRRMAG